MKAPDPIGCAIEDFVKGTAEENIIVECDLSEDDIIPVGYLFRNEDLLPEIEKIALSKVKGSVLDIGAAAGPHSKILKERGFEVTAIDTSEKGVDYLKSIGINAIHSSILDYSDKKYDTLLLLMNGIGIAGRLAQLTDFLSHCASLLNEGGRIICDSTDVQYFFEEDDGSLWVDLNTAYFGEFKFKMKYKDVLSDWFDWLYVDLSTLEEHCTEAGLKMEVLYQDAPAFLVEIKKNDNAGIM
ncbi:MAG: SAM-dependent methyltransferase [Fluviicola sp.]|nr:MAG: SAM-dependent methyltransferase [Fluviicola sp.]